MSKRNIESFLTLARRGWPLFPVGEDKLPCVKDWENAATTDEARLREQFSNLMLDHECNFGFPPGRADLLVIDVDLKKVNGMESLKAFCKEHGETLPHTFTVKTPSGGFHFYYKAAGLRSKNNFLPGVDIKSNGGFVIAPGSADSRGCYEITRDQEPAELPDWFRKAYNRPVEHKQKQMLNYSIYVVPDSREKIEEAIRRFQEHEAVPEGERNTTLYGFMRDLCKLGVTMPRALELYRIYGIPVFGLDPDETEVRRTTESAYSDPADFGSESQEGRKARVLNLLTPIGEDKDGGEDEVTKNGGHDLTELMAMEPRPRVWFIDGWLSAEPGSTVLYSGRGGAGKSATILDLMLALATGTDWFGLKVTHPAKSYFVTCEDSENEVNLRLRLGDRREKAATVPKGTIKIWSRLGKENLLCSIDRNGNMKEGNFAVKLRKSVKEFFGGNGGVLILDTVSDFYGGNENARSEVSRFVKQILAGISLEAKCTIIVLAHPSKVGDGYSGSTAWEAAFRGRWELNYKLRVKTEKGTEQDKLDGPLVLSNAKANYTAAGNHITLKNEGGWFSIVPEMTEIERAEWEENRLEMVYERISETAEKGAFCGHGAYSLRPIGKEVIGDLTSDEILEAVQKLTEQGRIHSVKINKRVCLTPVDYKPDAKRRK